MKNTFNIKRVTITLFLTVVCYAPSSHSSGFFDAIDEGLTTIEESTQSGRQIMDSATTTANTIEGTQIGLTDILVDQLGVTQQQALGGAGAIFQLAQGNMDPQDFSTLSQSIPGMNEMLNAAPVMPESVNSLTSGLSSLMGDTDNTLGSLATLTNSFQQLDLSPEMVGKFVPIVTDYVSNTSGQLAADLLQSALALP